LSRAGTVVDGCGRGDIVDRARTVTIEHTLKAVVEGQKRMFELLLLHFHQAALFVFGRPLCEVRNFAGVDEDHRAGRKAVRQRAGTTSEVRNNARGFSRELLDGRAALGTERNTHRETGDAARVGLIGDRDLFPALHQNVVELVEGLLEISEVFGTPLL
jgi:hypothetical protein